MKKLYETHSMPQTADNVAADFGIGRADQDAFALRSQQRWAAAHAAGRFADELVPVEIPRKKGDPIVFDTDEHPRPETTLEMLAKLKGVNGPELTVTAGNASGVNDGACALLLASDAAAGQPRADPKARVVAMATAGLRRGSWASARRRRCARCSPRPASASTRWTSSSSTKPSPPRAWRCCATWAWPTTRRG
jgi:acetyl-CoA acetyltransferase